MTVRRVERPDILASLPASGHAVVEASAGTGKTYTLESLVVELILVRGLPVESLLVVTFTDKAAAELTTRVRERLRRLAAGREEEAPPGRPDADCWLLDESGRRLLRRALSAFENASISTIHAFCMRVLSEHAFLGGQLLAQETVPEEAILRRALLDAARGELSTDPALAPWLEAWLAEGSSPRGGTRLDGLAALLRSIRRVRGTREPALDPAALAATVRGFPALHDEDAVRAALRAAGLGSGSVKAVAGPLHRICARVDSLRDEAGSPDLYLRLRGDGRIPKELKYVLAKAFGTRPLREGAAASLRAACVALDRQLVPLEAAIAAVVSPLVEERLRRLKAAEGLLDFDDMLSLLDEALRGERGEALRQALRARYRAALIDEFQDTDELQWSIFRRLFLDASEGHSLFLVGDPKQAIYRFRGADVRTYLAARDEAAPGDDRRLRLSTSWRATPALAEALNVLGDDRAASPLLADPIPYGDPLTSARDASRLVLPDGAPAEPFLLLAVPPGAARGAAEVRHLVGRGLAREARRVLDRGLLYGERGDEKPIEPEDLLVLTRTGNEGKEIAGYLEEEGIPAGLVRRDGLFDGDEVEDVRTLLLALEDPDDPALRARLLLSPFLGLTLEDLSALRGLPSDSSHLAPLRAWRLAAEAREWETLLPRVLDESGLVRRSLFLTGGDRALSRVEQLFDLLLAEGVRTRASAGELASWLRERSREASLAPGEEGAERAPALPGAVPVLTMHAAKGLQATVVFLYGGFTRRTARDEVRPLRVGDRRLAVIGRSRDAAIEAALDREDDAEDRRLLYVAVTRARARVVLPFFPEGVAAEMRGTGPEGSYGPLNARLRALARDLSRPDRARQFALRPIDPLAVPLSASRPGGSLSTWTPPVLPPLPDEETERAETARLLAERGGLVLTSFSGLKARSRREAAREAPGRIEADAPLDASRDVSPGIAPDGAPGAGWSLPEGELPPGIPTGLLLHALLEEADLEEVGASPSAEAWGASPRVAARTLALLSRNGIDARHLARATGIVRAALTTPYDLGAGRELPPLCRAPRVVREMEFLFPLAPRNGVERGFVQGFVDAVVEADGRVFVLDWKSDLLPRFEPGALAAHVEASYALQARLYSAAVARLLGLHDEAAYEARFGGHLYVFLRALDSLGPRSAVAGRVPFRDLAAMDEEVDRLLDLQDGEAT